MSRPKKKKSSAARSTLRSHSEDAPRLDSVSWDRLRTVGAMLLIPLLVLTVFSNALSGPFLFDDEYTIIKNPSLLRWWTLSQSLWAPQDAPTAGRPLVNLSFAINYAISGKNVFSYHLVNVLLHLFNGILLYWLIQRSWSSPEREQDTQASRNRDLVPLAVTALWCIHPLQTETVNYLTQRTELMMAFFLLSTLLASRNAWNASERSSQFVWKMISLLACGMGMACKEVMVVAPVLVVLYDLTIMKQSWRDLLATRKFFYLGLFATWGILAALLASNPRGKSVGFGHAIGPWDYLTTQFYAIANYLWLALWPSRLSGDYGEWIVTDIRQWGPCAVLLCFLLTATAWTWMRHRRLSFLTISFFLLLAPTSSIVPIISEPIAERRMYLPLATLLVIAAVMIARWKVHIVLPLSLVLLTTYGVVSHARNRIYQSEIAFWNDVIEKRPNNARGYQNRGHLHLRDNQFDLALLDFERSKELAPSKADSYYNLGVWHTEQGHLDEAIAFYDQAIALDSESFAPLFNRAVVLTRLGRIEESIEAYQDAIRVRSTRGIAYLNLGNLYFFQMKLDEAERSYRQAIEKQPTLGDAYQNLGAVLAKKGDFLNAIDWLRKALAIDPQQPNAWSNLGRCHAALRDWPQAAAAYRAALANTPNDWESWINLGKVYLESGEQGEARACFERGLQLQPNSQEAQQALEKLGPRGLSF